MTLLFLPLGRAHRAVSESTLSHDRFLISPISSAMVMLCLLLCGQIRWGTFPGYSQRFCRRDPSGQLSGPEAGAGVFLQHKEHL